MAHKQILRANFQQKAIDRALLTGFTARAVDALDELRSAPDYSFVIVNHDGEGSANWNRQRNGHFVELPRGDANAALDRFVEILKGSNADSETKWNHGVI